jgi:hypothetical protein
MLMASLLRCSFFRFQPELDQAANGLGATDLVVVGPDVDLGRQADGADRFRLNKWTDSFWRISANENWLGHQQSGIRVVRQFESLGWAPPVECYGLG